MHLVLHTGAHFTEEDRLMKCLLRNKGDFARRGVVVPGPGQYRRLLRDTMNAMRGKHAAADAREVLLDAFADAERPERLILSNSHFFGAPRACLRQGVLYPAAAEKLFQFRQLFPEDRIEMFMAIRNPATLLPAMFQKSPREDFSTFLSGVDPRLIRWSHTFSQLRQILPDIEVTLWCNEDAPLIWAAIIREMAGLPEGRKIIGGFDLLASIMSPEGMVRFRAYLKAHPIMTEPQKRRVMAAFLDKFVLEDELEEVLDLPGWTDELVEQMTAVYDDDMYRLQQIDGVRLILP